MNIDNFSYWLKSEQKSHRTIKDYIKAVQIFNNWYCEEMNVSQIDFKRVTTHDITLFRDDFLFEKKPSYVNKILAGLTCYMNYLVEAGVIRVNPALKVKRLRISDHDRAPKSLNHYEYEAFFRVVEEEQNEWLRKRDLALCMLLAGTGIRNEEAADLVLSDIIWTPRHEEVIIRHGKGGIRRHVPLNHDVLQSLRSWLSVRESKTIKEEAKHSLFLSSHGNRMSDRLIRYVISKYQKKALIPIVSPHIFRHTFATMLIENGYDITYVKTLLGHKNIQSTSIYTKLNDNMLRQAVNSLSKGKSGKKVRRM